MELIGSVPQPEQYSEDTTIKFKKKSFKNVQNDLNRSTFILEGTSPLREKIVTEGDEPTIAINHLGANETNVDTKLKSDHFETFMKIHRLNSAFGAICGLEMCKTWKYNNATRWTKFMLILGTGTAIYSHLEFISQPTKLIEVFSLFAVIAPAFLKFNLFIKSYHKTYKVNEFLEDLFKINADGPKAHVLKTHIDGTFTRIKIFIFIQTLALLVFACYPFYAFVANNEFVQIMPMQFPFLDQSTRSGIIVANLIMLKMGVWAYVGSLGFDIFLARFIYNYTAMVKLLQQDLRDYVEMCQKTNESSKPYRKAFFHNFLLKCQDKDRFLQFINDTYADVIFKQFGIVYICLIFAIYAIIRSNWYSGYGFVVFCLSEIYILCILGTAISIEQEKANSQISYEMDSKSSLQYGTSRLLFQAKRTKLPFPHLSSLKSQLFMSKCRYSNRISPMSNYVAKAMALHIVEILSTNEKFCAAIYEIPWYDYPVSEQKEILLLLHSSQNAMELWVGPFAPLNVETALNITKSIYSTSTMIVNTQQ